MIGTKRVGGRKRALPMTIDLHVMITLENGVYDAVCLEMGLATSSPDLEAVQRDLAELILAHIRGCLEEGRPQDMFVPAPPEYWAEYAEAVASDACHQRKKLPMVRSRSHRRPRARSTRLLLIRISTHPPLPSDPPW